MVMIDVPIEYEDLRKIIQEPIKNLKHYERGDIKGLTKIKVPKKYVEQSQDDEDCFVFGCIGCRP